MQVVSEVWSGKYRLALEKGTLDHYIHEKLSLLARSRAAKHAEDARAAAKSATADSLASDLIKHARIYHPHLRHAFSSYSGIGASTAHPWDAPSDELKELLLEEMGEEDDLSRTVMLKNADMRRVRISCFHSHMNL